MLQAIELRNRVIEVVKRVQETRRVDEIVNLINESGTDDIGYTGLHHLIILSNAPKELLDNNLNPVKLRELVIYLLDNSDKLNLTWTHNLQAASGFTLLHLAAIRKQPEIISALLRANVAHLPSKTGHTPLHLSAFMGDQASVQLLLAENGGAQMQNIFGKTAWDMANSRASNREEGREFQNICTVLTEREETNLCKRESAVWRDLSPLPKRRCLELLDREPHEEEKVHLKPKI